MASPPVAGAFRAPPSEEKQTIPDITPMRRGRPSRTGDTRAPKPSPSPLRGAANDPWAVLDSTSENTSETRYEDASKRFPALDDFSLLHDSNRNFAFDPSRDPKKRSSRDISQRVTDALADDAFAQPKAPTQSTQQQSQPHSQLTDTRPKPSMTDVPKSKPIPIINTPQITSPRPEMVSIGTMTSPSPPSPTIPSTGAASHPIFRFPSSASSHRSSSQPRVPDTTDHTTSTSLRSDVGSHKRPAFLEHRSRSQILTNDALQSPQSSLEADHRSMYLGGVEGTIQRSRSASSKARPSSVQVPSKPSLLRRMSREKTKAEEIKHESFASPLISAPTGDADDVDEAIKIDSNVDFLKAMEEEDASKRKEKRLSSGSRHIKRASMPSVSLSGTKNLLAGRFGDAFKRFETNGVSPEPRDSSRSPERGGSELTPIAGSEATDGRSDDGHDLEESQEVPPEMRRELERRRLSQEEKRVADAAAAYRQRLAQGGDSGRGRSGGGPVNNKAMSIQSKVKTLLDESGRASPSPTKAASGYGRFPDSSGPEQPQLRQTQQEHPPRTTSRQLPRPNTMNPQQMPSPIIPPDTTSTLRQTSNRLNPTLTAQPSLTTEIPRHSAPPSDRPFTRPTAPPKPQTKPPNLRTGDRAPQAPTKQSSTMARKPLAQPSRQQQQQQQQVPPANTANVDGAAEDWEANFSKRYPDLAGLEMVETELDGGVTPHARRPPREVRVRDV